VDWGPNRQARGAVGATVGQVVTRRIRPYAVLNGYGEQLATFADWEKAHAWAHLTSRESSTILPLEVEDRSQRITRRITRETCELIAWTIFTKISGCEPSEDEPRISPYIPSPGM
jgi:hypothetical protein